MTTVHVHARAVLCYFGDANVAASYYGGRVLVVGYIKGVIKGSSLVESYVYGFISHFVLTP